MSGPKPTACLIGKCASEFPYKDECGLTLTGCCAERIVNAARQIGGARFPMDLRPEGNPFLNALEKMGFVRVSADSTVFVL